jgi:L-lactate dehydrogenase complex protein LldE
VRVALFATCLGDTVFPDVPRATVQVLERLGHTVAFPAAQTCCGQLHLNSGDRQRALEVARRNEEIFAGYEAVVAPSASCVGVLRELAPPLADRVWELSEFLADKLGVDDVGASFRGRVTYHPTCHSLRVTRVGDAPLRLLRAVRGLELVELPDASECCGFGGTFSVKNPDVSTAMLADKCAAIAETKASVCTAVDGSCLMHIGGGLSRQNATARTVHLAEILASDQLP